MEDQFVGCTEIQTQKIQTETTDKFNCSHTGEVAWKHHTGGLVLGKSAFSQLLDTNLHRNTAYNYIKKVEHLCVELEQELIRIFSRLPFAIKYGELVEAKAFTEENRGVSNFFNLKQTLKKLYLIRYFPNKT